MGIFLFIKIFMKRGDMMEIKISDVDVRTIKVLDEEAKQSKVCTNTLLKRIVKYKVKFDSVKGAEKEFDMTMNRVADVFEMTYQRLNHLEKQTFKMYLLLCGRLGSDPTEVEGVLEKSF